MEKKHNCHCSGWATRNDLLCGDGRTIRKDAFKHNDGCRVPLIWNHDHTTPDAVLGHADLENREDGVYAYLTFNDSELGKRSKHLVEHGDVRALSIWANKLKQIGNDVIHGDIKELSLVLAGANPGAFIDFVIAHSDGPASDDDYFIASWDENTFLIHSSAEDKEEEKEEVKDKAEAEVAEETEKKEEPEEKSEEKSEEEPEESSAEDDESLQHDDVSADETDDETIGDVIAGAFSKLDEKEKNAIAYVVGKALEQDPNSEEVAHSDESDENEGGNTSMKHNVFDQTEKKTGAILSHSDEENILKMAKANNVGSLRAAMSIFADNSETLQHGFSDEDLELLFPDFKNLTPGAPELVTRDQGWVSTVMRKTSKTPISRIRTRQMDARGNDLRAFGYKKGEQKKLSGNPSLITRTTDPQTIYRKDALHRDDIIDITDFDVVAYQWNIMRANLNEEIALAIMVGDGREDGAPDKIEETHVRSIWNDDELYTIHTTVDIEGAKKELQGSETGAHFGDNYVYAEAIIAAALYSREQYKGSGNMDFYCTPHLLNVMLLARDLNGRRIYSSKADLAAALNVNEIHTVEQFEGLVRDTKDGKKKKLLGIFVNLADYKIGSTKGGEITKFTQFDIDFNQEKYLIETRISGALDKIKSAIALEEDVTAA